MDGRMDGIMGGRYIRMNDTEGIMGWMERQDRRMGQMEQWDNGIMGR